jgi:hypothetical protein
MSESEGPRRPLQPCCDEWQHVHQPFTDSEGWGPLVVYYDGARIGSDGDGPELPPVRFCPWCGAAKDAVETDEYMVAAGYWTEDVLEWVKLTRQRDQAKP